MGKEREYIAYAGEQFVFEWYYDGKGKSEPLLYFEDKRKLFFYYV